MKNRIVAAGVALVLALSPMAVDAKSVGGFSSTKTTSSSSSPSSNAKPEAGGKGFGGFSAFKSNSTSKSEAPETSKSTNSGFSTYKPPDTNKPAAVTATQSSAPQSPPPGRNGFSSAGVTAGSATAMAAAAPVKAQPSAVDRLAQKSNSQGAFAKFKQEQAAYKAPPVAPPVNQAAARQSGAWQQYGSGWSNPNAYAQQRQSAFERQPDIYINYYQRPPSYIRSAAYGALAGGFLALVLDRATDPGYGSWAYSHQNDPDYMAWHRDMMNQARDNADLREKLARLDQKVDDMRAQNAPVTTSLPQGIDASMVVAPETAVMATTADEPEGHPVWTFIKWAFYAILAIIAFLGACVFVSQRKRAHA